MKIFDEIESEVQSYARSFPRVFTVRKAPTCLIKRGINT